MDSRAQILVVDDDVGLLKLLVMRLNAAGYTAEAAESGEMALARLAAAQPQLVVTDLRMDGIDGMTLYNAIHQRHPTLPVIILTAHGTIPEAVDAIKRGVFGYLTKPFDSKGLLKVVEQALRVTSAHRTTDGSTADRAWRSEIISQSAVMEDLLQQARLVADSEASVLIQSESGTGKELLARAIHRASRRREQPFVAMNCSAIPETLLESELFGHMKGAFTGATQNHKGLFQAANRGTLFLDEIGDMSLTFQAKLLRVLQEKEVRPVGSSETIPVDVRVISATHRDLDRAVVTGEFRQDLYYRLNVVTLRLPTLAQRPEDIPMLVGYFLAKVAERSNKEPKTFAPEAMELLVGASWPGNVRQLQNVVEHTFALSTSSIITASLVNKALNHQPSHVLSFAERRDQFERDYLTQLLRMTQGNVSRAARLAQRNRTEFYKLLRRYHLEPKAFRGDGATTVG
ncbi:MAG: sigma 54-interacting transcriptional regulator [Gammaproteobacteria bacterium]|nr:sigma 54-interacting transcriptional regulator [Gammaproteobacteria bacterium]